MQTKLTIQKQALYPHTIRLKQRYKQLDDNPAHTEYNPAQFGEYGTADAATLARNGLKK